MKIQKGNQGISLLALVITIIVLIILAGITINLVLDQNGILNKGREATETYAEQQAKEKLEMELANLFAEKQVNAEYNENEYLTNKLEEKGFIVNENIVFVDDWQFEIDRSIPQIGVSLGKGNKNEEIRLTVSQVVSTNYVKSTIKAEIEYSKEIEYIQIAGEKKEGLTKGQDGKYTIEKDVTENGTYSVYVKDTEGNYNIGNIKVEEITEDMIIKTVEDLVKFRDNVNSGRTYEGKTVTLASDIDLSSVCGEGKGSWVPIGDSTHTFKGTFNGNYKTISNLYDNTVINGIGLFLINNGTIENLIIKDTTIITTSSTGIYAGILVRKNQGDIINCGIENGNMTITSNDAIILGGIASVNYGNIFNCYNKSNIIGTRTNGDYIRIGGIVGEMLNKTAQKCNIENCYNTGNITGKSGTRIQIGGICGSMYFSNTTIRNCYNTGKVSGTASRVYMGGIIGSNGESKNYPKGNIYNSYSNMENAYSYYYFNGSSIVTSTEGKTQNETLKTYAEKLGVEYISDEQNNDDGTWKYNNGYPILKWQLEH